MNKRPVVLSLEQALSLPYGTLRFVHQGWRVIRIEATPVAGRVSKGDPNRYIGRPVAGEDRHSYYVAPNVGKESIALNLKEEEGREALYRIIDELGVDVFCTNTMPGRHQALGVDEETLRGKFPGLIWCSVSAMGTDYPDVPGYDPAIQALMGFMDLTGERDGRPLQCGPPITDLKAGDEVFTQTLLAMLEGKETGQGKKIDISLAHCAASWLHTFTPMLDMGSSPEEIRRNGNSHRQFIPVNSYPTSDGFIYIAVGSDAQWARLVEAPLFEPLNEDRYRSNEGRRASQEELHGAIAAITSTQTSAHLAEVLSSLAIPHSPITPIEEVADLPFVAERALKTTTPSGDEVRLPPPVVPVEHLESLHGELPFPPAYGEQTDAILAEAGFESDQVQRLREAGVIA
ncbi:MAG: CoA transferase [Planctomycetota bacterium]|jgi:crotonobetainyl-CoA:carnitine CoA-transferase CaiB-like acyl-CoA transferase|nr:CoA transferase [Candidatus Woesearchaeota archaeon]MDP6386492.1 CoA transferase [Planctomycetota bacterium]